MVHKLEPRVRLCADSWKPGACLGFCVSLSLPLPHLHVLSLSLSLSLKNKHSKNIFLSYFLRYSQRSPCECDCAYRESEFVRNKI